MTENDIMAELSYAYLHAVAARAGFGCAITTRIEDNDGIDAKIHIGERLASDSTFWNFSVDVQLKSTKQTARSKNGRYSYFFRGVDRYNGLRNPGSPLIKLLVVLFLPKKPEQWLKLDEKSLVARRCAYWVSLNGAPPSENDTGQTIYLPTSQVLSVEGLRGLALRLSREEVLAYDP